VSDDDTVERLAEWVDVIEDANYYEILGLLELADDEAIKIAFREFAVAFHPDMYVDASDEERDLAHDVFRRGAEAYRVLQDPVLRAKYDLALGQGHLRLIGGGPARRVEGQTAIQSLEEVCRTPAAKLCARKADQEISKGNLAEARRFLKEAEAHDDYENLELAERLEGLDLALFVMGD